MAAMQKSWSRGRSGDEILCGTPNI